VYIEERSTAEVTEWCRGEEYRRSDRMVERRGVSEHRGEEYSRSDRMMERREVSVHRGE